MDEHGRIDGHKMMFHPEWVARWKKGKDNWQTAKSIYPLYIEISPSGICNHRCTFCGFDFARSKRARCMPKDVWERALRDMAEGGVKSILCSGEGEPALHPQLADIIIFAKNLGIDAALVTNGPHMDKKFLLKALKAICWIKVSIDAGTRETHLKIHRPLNKRDWEKIFANLGLAVELKRKNNYECRIGAQMLLLPESRDEKGDLVPGNICEAVILAEKLKKIGVDYFVIKPYSHQPLSLTKIYAKIDYSEDYGWLEKELDIIKTGDFEIIFRSGAMKNYSQKRNYTLCASVPFLWAHIMTSGSVYSCGNYVLDGKFYLGNIKERPFKEIWEGENRKRHWEFMKNFNPQICRQNCRMEEDNKYLWEMAHPPYNANFI